jgi:hypothetical protein
MKFGILHEVIAFPKMRKAMIVSSKNYDGEESYRLARESCFTSVDNLLSLQEFREDLKLLSETLFSLSAPVQQELIKMGVLKFLIIGDSVLCEELNP